MATGSAFVWPKPQAIDGTSTVQPGAQLFFYTTEEPGTLQTTFEDPNLTVPNPNPVIADGNGQFGPIWLQGSPAYNVQLWTAPTDDNPVGVQVWSIDPWGPGAGGGQTNITGIVGEVRMYAGTSVSIPSQWYLCGGQAVSRTTYAAAFSVLGTTWGNGDGMTTFNLPDLRGRAMFGLDNMGGTPANRITSGVSGISGITLGGAGGDQNSQDHTHALTDPGHQHPLVDAGHLHNISLGLNTGVGTTVTGNSGGVLNTGHTQTATTGITMDTATTGITIANFGAGESANMPPAAMVYMIIFLGA
jgi:microcystin-dependent protein